MNSRILIIFLFIASLDSLLKSMEAKADILQRLEIIKEELYPIIEAQAHKAVHDKEIRLKLLGIEPDDLDRQMEFSVVFENLMQNSLSSYERDLERPILEEKCLGTVLRVKDINKNS